MSDLKDFKIQDSALIKYVGNDNIVAIPNGVTEIEKDAFADCSSMKEIYIYNKNCFIKDETSIDKNVTIYGYTDSTAEAYANKYNRKFVALDNDAFSAFVRFFDSFVQFVKTLFNQLLNIFSFK